MKSIDVIIFEEEKKIKESNSSKMSAEILYNLIFIKNRRNSYSNKYIDIKLFFNHYIDSKIVANFGYDNINYKKINNLIDLLSPAQRIAIIDYFLSKLAKEFPEANREWFVEKKHEYEISLVFNSKQYHKYPKAIFLFLGKSIYSLLSVLLFFYVFTSLLLLPAFFENYSLFKIEYENYSDSYIFNHFLNILSLFSNLDNNFKIIPKNWFGLILLIIGKISFILLIVNFIYIKITDKITEK